MLSIQDYRNGRYQGQLKDKLPHGIGIFMQINLTFLIAQWTNGSIDGSAVVIFPDGSTFCGRFQRGKAQGTAFYELSHDYMKVIEVMDEDQPITAILLPLENKILQINKTNFEITREYNLTDNNETIQLEDAARIIKLSNSEIKFYKDYPNCYTFFDSYFCRKYADIFEQIIITINGYKQYWMGFKEQGLGVKLEPVKDSYQFNQTKSRLNQQVSKVHRCLDGKVYMIREMGMMSKQNTLVEYGLKTTNEMLKGYTIQQGVFELPHTITRYQSTTSRPKLCTQTFANHLKRSFHYRDMFMDLSAIQQIMKTKNQIESDVINHNKELLAHSLIQSPNMLKQKPSTVKQESQKQNPEKSRQSPQKVKQSRRVQPVMTGDKDWNSRLLQVKKEIYNTIQLKKNNKNLENLDYTNISKKQEIVASRQKQKIPMVVEPKKEELDRDTPNRKPRTYVSPNKKDSKSKEVIDVRKNGSITPKKEQIIIPSQLPLKTSSPNKLRRYEPIQSRSPPKTPLRTSPGFILKNEKTKSTLKSSSSKPKIAYRDYPKQIQTKTKQVKKQDLRPLQFMDETPRSIKRQPINSAGYGNKSRSPQKSTLSKYIPTNPVRDNDTSSSNKGYLSRNKKKRLLNELENFDR